MVIAFIGLGEVGTAYACGLALNGARVKGYDIKFETEGKENFVNYEKCKDAGVDMVDSPQELVDGADIIIAVTSCSQAMDTAVMYKPFLKKNQRYCEWNSTVPELVRKIEDYIGDKCTFIDCCTLSSPSMFGVKTPCCSCGPEGEQIAKELNAYGMQIQYLGETIGQASAFKVIRSIFTKSLEATLVESLVCARYYGVEEDIFKSIIEFLTGEPTDKTLAMMVRTNMIHSKRRGDEICEIAVMEDEAGLENTMALAATKKLYWLASLGLKEKFGGMKANSLIEALDAILEAQEAKKTTQK